MTAPVLRVRGLTVCTPDARPLVRELSLTLGSERVAVIGRNGVGKSTLLELFAKLREPTQGVVQTRGASWMVPQTLRFADAQQQAGALWSRAQSDPGLCRVVLRDRTEAGLGPWRDATASKPSHGQARKLSLLAAKHSGADLLLLDEPTEDLDEVGVRWLCRWLQTWRGGLVVVSHHRALLRTFEDFFVVSESGCRHLHGNFEELTRSLEREETKRQRKYVEGLNILAGQERHDETVRRRRARKKNVGRVRELGRCGIRLNDRRGYAQRSQAKAAKVRAQRIGATRRWAQATRRALRVTLPLKLRAPQLPPEEAEALVELQGASVCFGGQAVLVDVDLRLHRQRVAVLGPNGAGKTTLLRLMLGQLEPTTGAARRRAQRVVSVGQGAEDWTTDDSLFATLHAASPELSWDQIAARIAEHRFPLALAHRPLRLLSPGERVRAALSCVFDRDPAAELLVLDEPTSGLDFVGISGLQRALAAWPGGLVVTSHDREFLDAVGFDIGLEIDGGRVKARPWAAGSVLDAPDSPEPHRT